MIQWIKSDFDQMHYNIWKASDPFKKYPEFLEYPEFMVEVENLNSKKIFKFIAFAFDKGSPLPKKLPDLINMKMEAAELAGFDRTEGMFKDEVMDMIAGLNPIVNQMVIRFIRKFHDLAFQDYLVFRSKRFQLQRQFDNLGVVDDGNGNITFEDIDAKAAENLLSLITKLTNSMEMLVSKMFRQEDVMLYRQALEESATYSELELTPEHIAERIRDGKEIVPIPVYKGWTKEFYSEEEG